MFRFNSSREPDGSMPLDRYENQGAGEHLISSGEEALSRGDMDEARECLERALHRYPFNAKVHNKLSDVYWRQGEKEKALLSLTRALELDPNDREVIANCSKLFQDAGKKEDAREILAAYLERKPWDCEMRKALEKLDSCGAHQQISDVAGFFNEHGEYQFGRGNIDHAKSCFQMALEQDPNHARAHNNLGVLYWQEEKMEQALEHLYQALDLDPEDSDVLFNGANALAAAGELDTAIELLKVYLQRNPYDESAWEDFTTFQRNSMPTWQPAGLPPEVVEIYIRMGEQLAQSKDFVGAAEAFQRALQLDPKRVQTYYHLGCLLIQLDQESDALSVFKEGLKIAKNHKESILKVGEILFEQGQAEEARALYKDYLVFRKDKDIKKALDRLGANARPALDSAGVER